MHGIEEFASGKPAGPPSNGPWWRELTSYHWFVFVVAALGWLFDTMDQQLFNLARVPALRELLVNEDPTLKGDAELLRAKVGEFGGYATSIFLIGWATGGLAFGVLGDRIGRARTMLWTILLYSLFTGLSAFSTGFWDFAFYRFLTGLGVGGEFAVGVALVAEVMPDRARPHALGLLQASSAIGNVTAALLGMTLGHLEETGAVGSAWRWMFVIGTAPALLAVLIRRNLKEPERWQAATTTGDKAGPVKRAGSYVELFGDPRWRHNALVGLALSFSGIVGLWGIGFFSIDLIQRVLRKTFEAEGLSATEVSGKLAFWAAMTSVTLNIGAFFGMYAFSQLTHYLGRRPAFAITFVLAMASTAMVFWGLDTFAEIFWMVPIMGFCQLALFGGYAIYFPELFPTHLRSTGTSFCYNVGRYVAAVGPALLGLLTSRVFAGYDEPMRYAGVTMCAVFLIGLAALPFAPETKGKPLPE
jgi:MFS family permease